MADWLDSVRRNLVLGVFLVRDAFFQIVVFDPIGLIMFLFQTDPMPMLDRNIIKGI